MKPVLRKVQVWIYYRLQNGPPYFLVLLTHLGRGKFWQPVTGAVERDESLESAALREAQEETGLEFIDPPRIMGDPFEFDSRYGQRVIEFGFALPYRSDKGAGQLPPVRLDPNEHMEYRWVESQEAARMVAHASNIHILDALLKELFTE